MKYHARQEIILEQIYLPLLYTLVKISIIHSIPNVKNYQVLIDERL